MELKELKEIVAASRNIVFFGGAGTSTESGIPDFRSTGGLFSTKHGDYAPETILSHDFFMQHVDEFYDFYKSRMLYPEAKPNPGHEALAELEQRGQLQAIITQNIDGLHQLAGSRNVLELHGTVHRNHCMNCNAEYDLAYILGSPSTTPLCQACQNIVKPAVVLYQENLDMPLLQRAVDYIEAADVLIVSGTSLTVQPAASLIRHYRGNKLVLINKSATPYDGMANYIIQEGFSKVMTELVY